MDPERQPATALIAFLREEGKAGRYTANQQRLLGTAVALVIRNSPSPNPTVGELAARIAGVENPFSIPGQELGARTLHTYRSRVRRVLQDFREKNAAGASRGSSRHQLAVPLTLAGDRQAELRYPADLSGPELDGLAQVLRRLADLLASQAQAIAQGGD